MKYNNSTPKVNACTTAIKNNQCGDSKRKDKKIAIKPINEAISLRNLFSELDYDMTSLDTDKEGNKLATIFATTSNGVEINITLPRTRVTDVDVYNALLKLSVL